MKMVKSLVLGSAAALFAMGGAQAADLPVKAKAVEYVRICSLYGAGFFYIPGTDTCIKLGGYLRADVTINGGVYDGPFYNGEGAIRDRYAQLPGVQAVTRATTSLAQTSAPVCRFSAHRRALPRPPSTAGSGSGAPKMTRSS